MSDILFIRLVESRLTPKEKEEFIKLGSSLFGSPMGQQFLALATKAVPIAGSSVQVVNGAVDLHATLIHDTTRTCVTYLCALAGKLPVQGDNNATPNTQHHG